MNTNTIRAVVVHRPTEYELLLAAHATRGQVDFFLRSRGQDINQVEAEHAAVVSAIETVLASIPSRWRRAVTPRHELSRFLFEPEDVILAVGQDGLVANVAKYLAGQFVVGVNPLPSKYDGPLSRHAPAAVPSVLSLIDNRRDVNTQDRTMVQASLDDGQRLLALNEVFVGHRSHQSARYSISLDDKAERHSSSGLIACTGTGATGWARSINRSYGSPLELPKPIDPSVCFFVREAWPSKATGTSITTGRCDASHHLRIVSEMNQGGVIFGDGIEDDYLPFDFGRIAEISAAQQKLRLVV
jgi:NAD kinase